MPSWSSNVLARFFRNLGLQDYRLSHRDAKPALAPSAPIHTKLPAKCKSASPRHSFPPQAISPNEALYSAQVSSLLFSKLPVELRYVIWEEVVGGNTIHLYWKDRDTLLGFVCDKQSPCISVAHAGNRNTQKELMWGSANDIQERDIVQSKGFMPLLLACRATYFEATKIMYSRNTFDFTDHWPNFKCLEWNMPLSALTSLASVAVRCEGVQYLSMKADYVNWKRMWETLALLKALRRLKVEMVPDTDDSQYSLQTKEMFTEAEDKLLEPVLAMTLAMRNGNRDFQLWVGFEASPEGEVAPELEQMGWRITRF